MPREIKDMNRWFLSTMLRKSRLAARLSQADLAVAVDRSPDSIRDWEKGKTAIPFICIDAIANACGIDDELKMYMKEVARVRGRRNSSQPIEADARLNALFLSLGEQYSGDIFKWEASMIPGPLQSEAFHRKVVREAEPASDQRVEEGWRFKCERRRTLEERTDNPRLQFLIGESALLYLRHEPDDLRQEQFDLLADYNNRPGWEIRILRAPVISRQGVFEIYGGDGMRTTPTWVYTEVHDLSWCISSPQRIASYDNFRQHKWPKAIPYEEYRYDF